MTLLGFRSTTGSQTLVWPCKEILINGFNKRHTAPPVIDETSPPEVVKQAKNVSKLSVGARALCKHAHRSAKGFWGNP